MTNEQKIAKLTEKVAKAQNGSGEHTERLVVSGEIVDTQKDWRAIEGLTFDVNLVQIVQLAPRTFAVNYDGNPLSQLLKAKGLVCPSYGVFTTEKAAESFVEKKMLKAGQKLAKGTKKEKKETKLMNSLIEKFGSVEEVEKALLAASLEKAAA